MPGYRGFSMSNNAAACYDLGMMPRSKWTRAAILERVRAVDPIKAEQFKGLKLHQLRALLAYDSYHHTGLYFNSTDFYRLDDDAIRAATFDDLKLIQDREPPKLSECLYIARVQAWSGTRKHPKMIGYEYPIGRIKGNWLISDDGKRYSLSASRMERYKRYEGFNDLER